MPTFPFCFSYLLATSKDAMYVAFMGTKQARDLVVDARFLHRPVWAESLALAADDKVCLRVGGSSRVDLRHQSALDRLISAPPPS